MRSVDKEELLRSFRAALRLLLTVAKSADPELADRLRPALLELSEVPDGGESTAA